MEKGRIKIQKNGQAKIDKKIAVPKLFDLSKYIPEAGSVTLDCEYELNEYNVASKIFIDGVELGEDKVLKKAKEDKEHKKRDDAMREEFRKSEEKKYAQLKNERKNNFVDISKSFIPKDSVDVLLDQAYLVDNFNLELNKLPNHEMKNNGKINFKFYQQEEIRKKEVVKPFFSIKPNFSMALISQISINEVSYAESLFKNKTSFEIINFKPNWRIIVGLGGESVYETSITLHHIYGIPYIPASSVKGVVRSWIINMVFGNDDLKFAEGRAIEDKGFCDVFGCPAELSIDIDKEKKIKKKFESFYTKTEGKKKGDRKGKVIFFDAFPIKEPRIEVDIMNVHYPDYYNDSKGKTAPTDTQNPNPIPFLTVAETDFQFIIGTKDKNLADIEIDGKTISDWLKEALSVNGIGAKTAVGYGRFSVV